MRHCESLMRTACQHLLRVQKSLDQMNVQLHHVVTDITGYTGLAILNEVQNRLANALRMAAQSLHCSNSGLGDWFRRLKSRLGTKAAVTAAAHKLARILWAMVKHRRPYDPSRLRNPELARARKERYLRHQAEQLGCALTPVVPSK